MTLVIAGKKPGEQYAEYDGEKHAADIKARLKSLKPASGFGIRCSTIGATRLDAIRKSGLPSEATF